MILGKTGPVPPHTIQRFQIHDLLQNQLRKRTLSNCADNHVRFEMHRFNLVKAFATPTLGAISKTLGVQSAAFCQPCSVSKHLSLDYTCNQLNINQ